MTRPTKEPSGSKKASRDRKIPGRVAVEAAYKELDERGFCLSQPPPAQQSNPGNGDKTNEGEVSTTSLATTTTTKDTKDMTTENLQPLPGTVPEDNRQREPGAMMARTKKIGRSLGEYSINALGGIVAVGLFGVTWLGVIKVGQIWGIIMTPEQQIEYQRASHS